MMEEWQPLLLAESSFLSKFKAVFKILYCTRLYWTVFMKLIISPFSNWETCANMFGSLEDTENPAKFKLRYWGAAAYLQTGCKLN